MKKFLLILLLLCLPITPAFACFIPNPELTSDSEIKQWYDAQKTIYQGIKLGVTYDSNGTYDVVFITRSLRGANKSFQIININAPSFCGPFASRFDNGLWGIDEGNNRYYYLNDTALDSLVRQNLIQNNYLISIYAFILYAMLFLFVLMFLCIRIIKYFKTHKPKS